MVIRKNSEEANELLSIRCLIISFLSTFYRLYTITYIIVNLAFLPNVNSKFSNVYCISWSWKKFQNRGTSSRRPRFLFEIPEVVRRASDEVFYRLKDSFKRLTLSLSGKGSVVGPGLFALLCLCISPLCLLALSSHMLNGCLCLSRHTPNQDR